MAKKNVDVLLGFGGVHPQENARALYWGEKLEIPMLLMALWIVLEWYLSARGVMGPRDRDLSDWFVWAFFLTETSWLVYLCDDKRRHLQRNWANLVIIASAIPFLQYAVQELGVLRFLRVLFLVGLFVHNVSMVRAVLAQNHLGKTLLVVVVFVSGGGVVISTLDPAIDNTWDGIWWAWVTVTTVGYGDVVPQTASGRVFAVVLMLMGISMLSLITANISAYLMARGTEKEIRLEQRELKKLMLVEDRLDLIEAKLDRLLQEMERRKKE